MSIGNTLNGEKNPDRLRRFDLDEIANWMASREDAPLDPPHDGARAKPKLRESSRE